jgi:predicted NBD/HSP70 family sugar kinase
LARVWVGIDAARQSHHAAAVDEHGQVLWSQRISNDQDALTELVDRVDPGDEVSWAVDLIGCETALLWS